MGASCLSLRVEDDAPNETRGCSQRLHSGATAVTSLSEVGPTMACGGDACVRISLTSVRVAPVLVEPVSKNVGTRSLSQEPSSANAGTVLPSRALKSSTAA